ncbi:hypothetical protein [Streptomyces gilvosporeus]|uniref:hypothetical protein n=1 Tax=Streptomyces gilvosporeus TaxID=553510 RepID=UPI00131C48CA|nr:hypothetical protein [Streptomyces gilvosporeus]
MSASSQESWGQMTAHNSEDRDGGTNRAKGDGPVSHWEQFTYSRTYFTLKLIGKFIGALGLLATLATFVIVYRPHSHETDSERVHKLSLGSDIHAVERDLGGDNRLTTYLGDSGAYQMGPQGPTKGLSVRIYRLNKIFVQVGYQTSSGAVVEWIVQSCDPKVQIQLDRSMSNGSSNDKVTLNKTTLAEMTSSSLPQRAFYNTPVDGPGERLEFSPPDKSTEYTSEIWGTTDGLCDSRWLGKGTEPLLEWDGGDHQPIDVVAKKVPWSELRRFRSEKLLNLYGQARPVYDIGKFPLLPGHGTPVEITGKYLPTPTWWPSWPGPSTSAS